MAGALGNGGVEGRRAGDVAQKILGRPGPGALVPGEHPLRDQRLGDGEDRLVDRRVDDLADPGAAPVLERRQRPERADQPTGRLEPKNRAWLMAARTVCSWNGLVTR